MGERSAIEQEQPQCCPKCGVELDWLPCWNGCEDGYFDAYEDDPINNSPGELEQCSECGGTGGQLACPTCHADAFHDRGVYG